MELKRVDSKTRRQNKVKSVTGLISLIIAFILIGTCAIAGDLVMYLPVWEKQIGGDRYFIYKPFEKASPAVSLKYGVVFVGTSKGRISAVDYNYGNELWYHMLDEAVEAKPLAVDDLLFIGSSDGALYALDVSKGKISWKYKTEAIITSAPVLAGGRIIFQNRQSKIYALDAKTGKWLWHFQRESPPGFTIESTAGPVVDKGLVFAGFPGGLAASLNVEDGSVVWTRKLGVNSKFNDIWWTPVIHDKDVCFSVYSEGIQCLEINSGETTSSAAISGATAPLFFENGFVTCTVDGDVVHMNNSGEIVKKIRVKGGPLSAPSRISEDYFITAASNGPVYVISWPSLEIIQAIGTGSGVSSPPTVTARSIFFMDNKGFLFKFTHP